MFTALASHEKVLFNHKFIEKVMNLEELSGVIEVRVFDASGGVQQLWFEEIDSLLNYEPPADKDVYFGVAARKNKKSGKSNNLTNTMAIWADYDNTDILEVKESLRLAEIPEASIYINSGHGIHCYWMLDKPTPASRITPYLKAIANKSGADPRSAEPARIMRFPGSYNNKKEQVKTEILELNEDKRYSLDNLKEELNINLTAEIKKQSDRIRNIKLPDAERPCINSILNGVGEGQRNWALGRLTKWLQMIGYSKQRSLEIVLAWNYVNVPPEKEKKIRQDFYSYWQGEYKLLGCSIPDKELQEMLSTHCDRYNCPIKGSIDNLEIDNYIKLNNRLFNDYQDISGYELIVYSILLAEKDGLNTTQLKKEFTHKDSKVMSRQRLSKAIKKLNQIGLISIKKRKGFPTFCKSKKQGTFGLGYTLVNNGVINGAIYQAITPAELKVYILLLKYAFNKGKAFPGTKTIADQLGIKRQTVSDHIKALEEARYLKRRYDYNEQGTEILTCILLV